MASYFGAGLQNIIPMLAGLGTVVQLLVLGSLVRRLCRLLGYHPQQNRASSAVCSAHDQAFSACLPDRRRILPSWPRRRDVSRNRRWRGCCAPRINMPRRQATATRPAVSDQQCGPACAKRSTHGWPLKRRELEIGLSFLATTASVTPFIGLLGTVWGIIQSFHAVGQGGSASLVVVGPGISEALVATAAGLGRGDSRGDCIQLFPATACAGWKARCGALSRSSCRYSKRCRWQSPTCRPTEATCRSQHY